jgi:DNA-binding response OmpR family regulator
MKVLIVEDEKDLAESIKSFLIQEEYLCDSALEFSEADLLINLYQYDCVIVDITLHGGSGFDIIKNLKEIGSKAGIIIISAKNSLDDKLKGLDIGADDYLTKPFHLAELNARIKSIIRRRQFEGEQEMTYNEIRINPEDRRLYVNDQLIDLTKKEFDLLLYLLSNKNQVLTKETIAEHLWGSNIDLVDSFEFIYSHVKNLRKKLEQNGCKDYIQTVYGIGYRFKA